VLFADEVALLGDWYAGTGTNGPYKLDPDATQTGITAEVAANRG
jgi:hypothetical protein